MAKRGWRKDWQHQWNEYQDWKHKPERYAVVITYVSCPEQPYVYGRHKIRAAAEAQAASLRPNIDDGSTVEVTDLGEGDHAVEI